MGGKASYKLVFEGKVDSSGQRAKLTCRLSSHINVITNQGGTSVVELVAEPSINIRVGVTVVAILELCWMA